MADETPASTAPVPEVSSTEQPVEAPRSYSQAEVDALLKQAKDREYAEARRVIKPKRQDEARPEKQSGTDKGEDREARREAQSDAIADAVVDYALTKEQRNKLRDRMRRDNPDDPAAWVKEELELFQPAKSPDPTKPNAQNKETPVAHREPGDHPGPPQGAPPWERPSNPFLWTEAEVQRLTALKGAREANRIIRQKAEAFARTMRIQMAPQRR